MHICFYLEKGIIPPFSVFTSQQNFERSVMIKEKLGLLSDPGVGGGERKRKTERKKLSGNVSQRQNGGLGLGREEEISMSLWLFNKSNPEVRNLPTCNVPCVLMVLY